jgi:UDP-N-acetylglucosamine 2-epimerase (non-hydrolysing)
MNSPCCMVVIGTRPEAIKMAPVVRYLKQYAARIETRLVATAQHREMLDQVLQLFSLQADIDLDLMQESQGLPAFAADAVQALSRVFVREKPGLILVQGDTTTALAASLAAFYERIPVAHVEAGLRSYDMQSPFPEEMNRRLITILAEMHFAPTMQARENLIREFVAPLRILVTGNPVIDALLLIRNRAIAIASNQFPFMRNGLRTVLVTAHRRENHGVPLQRICRAVSLLVRRYPNIQVIWPVHPNPRVATTVRNLLGKKERIYLTKPLDYCAFVGVLALSEFALTDSGGVQEEGPALGKPVLILRDTTERPEGVAAGVTKLVGSTEDRILQEASLLLESEECYRQMARQVSPYGDGRAAERIFSAICSHLGIEASSSERSFVPPEEEYAD